MIPNAVFEAASRELLKSARPPLAVPTCPACVAQRTHTPAEWKNHPLAGHGFTPETGWSLSEAKAASEAERAKALTPSNVTLKSQQTRPEVK